MQQQFEKLQSTRVLRTSLPHVLKAELYGDGTLYEISLVKVDEASGDFYYLRNDELDPIDQRRLLEIVSRRDANRYPLWDLMHQVTLKNGVNALEFFHQLAWMKTASGKHYPASGSRQGISNIIPQADPATPAQLSESVESEEPVKRGPGRPPKSDK